MLVSVCRFDLFVSWNKLDRTTFFGNTETTKIYLLQQRSNKMSCYRSYTTTTKNFNTEATKFFSTVATKYFDIEATKFSVQYWSFSSEVKKKKASLLKQHFSISTQQNYFKKKLKKNNFQYWSNKIPHYCSEATNISISKQQNKLFQN